MGNAGCCSSKNVKIEDVKKTDQTASEKAQEKNKESKVKSERTQEELQNTLDQSKKSQEEIKEKQDKVVSNISTKKATQKCGMCQNDFELEKLSKQFSCYHHLCQTCIQVLLMHLKKTQLIKCPICYKK